MLQAQWEVNGRTRQRGYWLADGIYPDWPIFLKTIPNPQNVKERYFAERQESVRKDVERAFGVLIARWHILCNPCRLWDVDTMTLIIQTCIILHNMIIEYEEDKSEYEEIKSNYPTQDDDEPSTSSQIHLRTLLNIVPPPGTLANFLQMRSVLKDETEYFSMRDDIINHLWNEKGKK